MKSKAIKQLPIGIQTIESIIKDGYVYVDKTELIFKLIKEGKYYFLSRPRRFGKSLLLSTLKAIFKGDKKLFKECKIHSLEYSWEKFPIIHLDFTQIQTKSPQKLEESLKRALLKIAKSYGKSITMNSLQEGFSFLIEKLSEKGKVVVLVDEYDKPIIDNVHNLEIAEENRALLKDLFGTLKGLDNYLRFVFVTGVSKFSHVSLFSGFNNLEDITISPHYATLLGYTEKELHSYFQERIKKIAKETRSSQKNLKITMRKWYNGYKFSVGTPTVYNPHSTLSFLKAGRIQCFWFQTGTPTFLIEMIKKEKYPIDQLSDIDVGEEVFDSYDLKNMNPVSLMWQTGYLTIKDYSILKRLYHLDYPNEEVKDAFVKRLAEGITGVVIPQVTNYARSCIDALKEQDLDLFFIKLKAFFASIPYDMRLQEEKYYQTTFYVLGQLMGLESQVEIKTNLGRIDMAIETDKIFYIFEFKIDQRGSCKTQGSSKFGIILTYFRFFSGGLYTKCDITHPKRSENRFKRTRISTEPEFCNYLQKAKTALKQIQNKKYLEKYLGKKKEILAVGVSFSTKERNISDWLSISYSSRGIKKQKLRNHV